MKKTLTIFALVYFVLEFATLFLIFGWNAFGGSNSMNIFQKAISFFSVFHLSGYLRAMKAYYCMLFPIQFFGHWYLLSDISFGRKLNLD